MSDNVTPLHPEKERRKRVRRRILYLTGTIVLVLAAVFVILFHQELNLDRIRRYVTYMNVRNTEAYGEYHFDAHSSNAYCAYNDGLAVASVAGLDLYGPSGEELASVPNPVSVPAVDVGKSLVLAYDVGGNVLCAAGSKSGAVLDLTTERALYDADISSGDFICYSASADGYKTVLTVLDSSQKEMYRWLSASQYMPLCTISDDGKLLAAVALGQSDGVFTSSLQLLPTDREETGPAISLGNQLILDMEFVSGKRLCAVGEESLQFLDLDGNVTGTYSYQDTYLKDFSLSGSGFVALSLNLYQAGSQYSIATVDLDGNEIGSLHIGEEILSVSAAGNYVAVLTANRLQIYTSDLTLYAETEELLGASSVAMRGDGSALLIGSGSAHLYLP